MRKQKYKYTFENKEITSCIVCPFKKTGVASYAFCDLTKLGVHDAVRASRVAHSCILQREDGRMLADLPKKRNQSL